MGRFTTKLKRIFWKLPFNSELKERMRMRYAEIKMQKEEKEESATHRGLSIVTNQSVINDYMIQTLSIPTEKSEAYKEYKDYETDDESTFLVAYYLTQFHPNDRNDEWWGKGTTEWSNVSKAVPQFVGHYQPRLPGELGYYDLRLKENMERQIALAKNYGINAFCYYYYWFDGERLLEKPLNMFLENKDLNMPFFYCWANENWTKRFSGTDSGVLMSISETVENYEAFIDSVIDDFKDQRYVRIKNCPVLSIYRPSLIPDVKHVIVTWRDKVLARTGEGIYLIAVQERDISKDWIADGFDAESEWQAKQVKHLCNEISSTVKIIRKDFKGQVFDYADLVEAKKYIIRQNLVRKVYPAVMPMWDNTARRNNRALIFHGSTPELYKKWLQDIVRMTKERANLDKPMIFVNAWNEWGEGTYLEPDFYYGYAYLESTKEAKS